MILFLLLSTAMYSFRTYGLNGISLTLGVSNNFHSKSFTQFQSIAWERFHRSCTSRKSYYSFQFNTLYSRLNKTEEVSLWFSRQVRLIPITRRVLGIIHVGGVIGYNQYVENNFYSVSPEAHASVYYSILHRVKSKVQFSYGHRFYDSSYGNDYRNYFRISAGIHFTF